VTLNKTGRPMFSLLRALHVHAAKRGDGLMPKLLTMSPRPHGKPMNENSVAPVEATKASLSRLSARFSGAPISSETATLGSRLGTSVLIEPSLICL
jgi:CRISPR/Cas system-associated exonuclease Cas4 (RecB family)